MFNGLTNIGKEYIAKCLAENKPITFTKVKIGDGLLDLDENAELLTDVKSLKKEVEILDKTQEGELTTLTILLDNSDIEVGYYPREIGIYVTDEGVEKLYWYINDGLETQWLCAANKYPIKFKQIINLMTTNLESVIVNWSGKDLFVDREFVEEKIKEKVRTFEIPTIAELQSRKNLKVGDIVEVLGYYTAGDGAGHKRIITNEDDGSGVQLKNGLWANIIYNDSINIKWLGAKGNGINDDTSAFRTQFNLFVPEGNFLINNTIKMQSGKKLFGENMYGSVIKIGADVDCVWINTDCTLENLAFNSDLKDYNATVIKVGDETFTKLPVNQLRCGVLIQNISYTFNQALNVDKDIGYVFHILFSQHDKDGKENILPSYWGLKIKHIRGTGRFARVFKIESRIKRGDTAGSWLTYSTCEDVRVWKFLTAIEAVATYEEGNYDSNEIRPVGGISFSDCVFECYRGYGKWGFISDGLPLNLSDVYYGDSYKVTTTEYSDYLFKFYKNLKYYGQITPISNPITSWTFRVDENGHNQFITIDGFNKEISSFFSLGYCRLKGIDAMPSYQEWIEGMINTNHIPNKKIQWLYYYTKGRDGKDNVYTTVDLNMMVKNYYDSVGNTTITKCSINYDISSKNMKILIHDCPYHIDDLMFVFDDSDLNNIKVGIVYIPTSQSNGHQTMGIQKYFSIINKSISTRFITDPPQDISDDELSRLKKAQIKLCGNLIASSINDVNTDYIGAWANIIQHWKGKLYLVSSYGKKYEYQLVEVGTPAQLNTPYHVEKMKQEGVYNDFITYMDEKTIYDKQQEKLEEQKQLSYKQALQENPSLSYEEFMSVQPMTLNLIEEPQPSKALQDFMDKYL